MRPSDCNAGLATSEFLAKSLDLAFYERTVRFAREISNMLLDANPLALMEIGPRSDHRANVLL